MARQSRMRDSLQELYATFGEDAFLAICLDGNDLSRYTVAEIPTYYLQSQGQKVSAKAARANDESRDRYALLLH
jgi:hypothetical protein